MIQPLKSIAWVGAFLAVVTAGILLFNPSDTSCACRPAESLSAADAAPFMPVVDEYFEVRKQALLSGDVTVLHKRYPELAQGTDLKAGINTEAFMIEQSRSLKMLDETLDLDYYEPIRAHKDGQTAIVVIHGQASYLYPDETHSVGEFHLTLTLRQQNGAWTVTQTDEKTLEEFHADHA